MAGKKLTTLDQLQMLANRANTKINQVALSVPTKTSQLTNDSNFQTDTDVASAISSIDHLSRKKVTSTSDIDPSASGAEKFIYMVPKSNADTNDSYDEYMVIDGKIEYVGNTKVDMTGFISVDDVASDDDVTTALDTIFGSTEGG